MPWNDSVRMSRSKFINFFVKRRSNKYGDSSRCKKLYKIDQFWNIDGTRWRCWNYHFWPVDADSPDSGVWNYYHFSRKYGDFTYIVEEQPKAFVNFCDYDQKKSDLIERKVWQCSGNKIRKVSKNKKDYPQYRMRFTPDYLPKKKNYLRYRRRRQMRLIMGPNGVIDKFVAILTTGGKTKYLTNQQFKDIFVNGGYEEGKMKNGKNGLYTMKNDLVEPVIDTSKKNMHYYNPVLLA